MSTILITGATSGIGEACARQLAGRGHSLWLTGRRVKRLEALAQELGQKVDCQWSALDLASSASIERFCRDQSERLGKTAVLINNAGLAKGLSTIQDGDIADWEQMFATNVMGLLHLTRRVLPGMIKARRGHIVNMGSIAGRWAYPKGNIYCATKSSVHMISETLRLDLVGSGVRVTEICPGMVNTEFSEVRLGDKSLADAVYKGLTPLSASDVADAVVWCLERPAHVNIQELVIYPTDQASPAVVNRKT